MTIIVIKKKKKRNAVALYVNGYSMGSFDFSVEFQLDMVSYRFDAIKNLYVIER